MVGRSLRGGFRSNRLAGVEGQGRGVAGGRRPLKTVGWGTRHERAVAGGRWTLWPVMLRQLSSCSCLKTGGAGARPRGDGGTPAALAGWFEGGDTNGWWPEAAASPGWSRRANCRCTTVRWWEGLGAAASCRDDATRLIRLE